ncbi:alkaline phosphatase PhoX [Actinomadura sp. WMMB 499]|uniref:alkaline phosphatase PhoX n=1 Tax=Actinomadura sp. WMMB 499 TaxID=1219491 RepID=UPI0020C754B8|nr:alkaline phosphatase PhoX [Actinomadura sp. WMMB 499]
MAADVRRRPRTARSQPVRAAPGRGCQRAAPAGRVQRPCRGALHAAGGGHRVHVARRPGRGRVLPRRGRLDLREQLGDPGRGRRVRRAVRCVRDVTSAYRILNGTTLNCAGGGTPWNTWLSCEEHDLGLVFETDPRGEDDARARPAMGRFKHEAAACDPERRVVYLTEDQGDGCFYRFVPATWGDLSAGTLQVLVGTGPGAVRWENVPNPRFWFTPTRDQVDGAMRFDGGEGCHYSGGTCYFTTKGDGRVWAYRAAAERLEIVYDDDLVTGEAPLTGVDNVTAASSGDLYVAEDGGNMEINIITPDGIVAPVLRVAGHDESEITGPAFSPDGTRLYFSSQRGESGFIAGTDGRTYEVTGPFRR